MTAGSTESRNIFLAREPEQLKALAHPMRQRLLFELVARDHARAADLAQATGEPANSVSFHLRTLARAGLIVEAPDLARDRRDRVWRSVADDFTVDPQTAGFDEHVGALLDVVRENVAYAREHGYIHAPEGDDGPVRTVLGGGIVLTRDQARKFAEEAHALYERFSDEAVEDIRSHPGPGDRSVYRIVFAIGPSAESR